MSVDPEAVADFVDRWGDYVEIFDVVPTAFRGDVDGVYLLQEELATGRAEVKLANS